MSSNSARARFARRSRGSTDGAVGPSCTRSTDSRCNALDSVTSAAESFGFSRVSFYKAQAAFKEHGLAGLVPSRRGPHGAHKLSEAVIDFLLQAADEDKSRRPMTLSKLVEERFGFSLHPRTIEKALAQRQKKPRSRI